MACVTESCVKVRATVQQWMERHPDTSGLWEVTDYQNTGDVGVLVTPHKAILPGLQTAEFTADLERKVTEWLSALAR